jgi:signal transduction histidine kinase
MARVLVVEDEKEICILYQSMISRMGHEVFVAKDAEEAKPIILREELEVALVDRILPGKEDGLDILGFIQANQSLCQTILVSGYPTFSSASEALRRSAFDYLTKPVQYTQLCKVIDAAVKEKKQQKEKVLEAEKNRRGYEELKTKQEMLQHDMRSLLVGIIGFTNLLINRTSLSEIQLEYCKQIQQCSIQLQSMIDNYFDISNLELEEFQVRKTKCDLIDIVKQSRKTLHFLSDEKNVDISIDYNGKELSIEDEFSFKGNRMYLQNAINNLLRNGIEASLPGQEVKIKIKDLGEHLSVSIHNSGIVPEDVRSTFFEKYATSGKKGGIGLGTYMADLVAKAHSGEIRVNSSEEEGTEVSMVLPLAQAR